MKYPAFFITIAAAAAIVALTVVALNVQGNSLLFRQKLALQNNQVASIAEKPMVGKLYLSDQYNLVLEAPGATLSGAALRIVIELSSAPKTTPTLKVNDLLIQDNWSFPIQEVVLDGKTLTIDLAALSVSPEGYLVGNQITLATIESVEPIDFISYTFDKDLSKVITKSGEELNISYQ